MTFGVPVQFYAVLKVDASDSVDAIKVAVDELNKADVCVVRRPAGIFEHSDDWDELDDPCAHCSHRTWATLEEFRKAEAIMKGGRP